MFLMCNILFNCMFILYIFNIKMVVIGLISEDRENKGKKRKERKSLGGRWINVYKVGLFNKWFLKWIGFRK